MTKTVRATTIVSVAGLVGALTLAMGSVRAQSAAVAGAAQSMGAPASAIAKRASDQFKNIQVLKDLDANQLQPAMQFIAASLGVECSYCHVENAPEKDDKPQKASARKMLQMTADINRTAFNGRRNVTCFSCHHGATSPLSIPIIQETVTPMPDTTIDEAASTAGQLLDRYLRAVGGADAVQKVTTRVEKGVLLVGQAKTPIEVYAKAPNKRVSITHGQNGDSFTAFDGTSGWLGNTGRPGRDMAPADSQSAGLDAEFALAMRAKQIFSETLRPLPSER